MLSLGLLLSLFSFLTRYAHHFGRPWPATGNRPTSPVFPVVAPDALFRNAEIQSVYLAHALGVASILLQAAFISAVVLLAPRRWGPRLPLGALAVVLGLNALMLGTARDQLALVPGAVAAGPLGDVLVRSLEPSPDRTRELRVVALAVPAIYFAVFFAGLALAGFLAGRPPGDSRGRVGR